MTDRTTRAVEGADRLEAAADTTDSAPISRRRFLAGVGATSVLAATGLLGAACTKTHPTGGAPKAAGAPSTLERARKAGKITVGYAGEAPHSFLKDGKLEGSAIAIDGAVYRELGIPKIDGVLVSFGQLIPGLKAGRFDAVSADMSILPDRCKEVAFSEPTFRYTTALMVAKSNPKGLTDLDSAKAKNARVCVMAGAIEGSYAKRLGIDATVVDDAQGGMDALVAGRFDAFALTAVSLNWMAKQQPTAPVEVTPSFVQVIDGVPQVGAGGATFRKEDEDLVAAFNSKLAPITHDKERYLSLTKQFGYTEAEMPNPKFTTAILCKGVPRST
ncbi:MAG: transporter substrate-binding domain-containing protein [Myxococcales bacterium]|nr:transporter substrate-binding domain-containing protein [Myxococcales bacterium]